MENVEVLSRHDRGNVLLAIQATLLKMDYQVRAEEIKSSLSPCRYVDQNFRISSAFL